MERAVTEGPRDGAAEALAHADVLHRLALHLARNPADAEDLVQETFVRALRAWGGFAGGADLRAWLLRILRNTFLDRERHARRHPVEGDFDEAGPGAAAAGDAWLRGDREPEQLRGLVAEEVAAALTELPEAARTLVLLDLEGLSEKELALVLGCAVGTVKSRLWRARSRLRDLSRRPPEVADMDCADARLLLLDLARGRLTAASHDDARRHLEGCTACRRALETETALDELLSRTVPGPGAPAALRRRLTDLIAAGPAAAAPRGRAARLLGGWRRWITPALAAGLVLALWGLLVQGRVTELAHAGPRLTDELINDHLRVLASQHPAEIESGGPHQVKPWFEGRLDFAPVVPAPELDELRLRGGAIGYVLDRRAAVIQYTLRLHRLTLLVVRADGLRWPFGAPTATTARGFQVIRWRSGQLGYALVSDVGADDLARVAEAFRAATGS